MHIVQVYHAKVPVALYGGMERVIESLCEGLLELGHKVTLIAYRGDYAIPGVEFLELDRYSSKQEAVENFKQLIPDTADVVHYHTPYDFDDGGAKRVFTLHGNLGEDEDSSRLPKNTIALSSHHAQRHGLKLFVYNGLNYQKISYDLVPVQQRSYFSFLGRASLKRKGLHLAKPLSRSLGVPLKVGGGRGLSFRGVQYLGQVNDDQKYQMLSHAKALLFPILWEEPFGLVMIESLFVGTPVFALRRGSVSEVLGLGEVPMGVIAEDYEELVSQVRNYDYLRLSPETIRRYAIENFSHHRMCESYLEIYSQV